MKKLSLLLAILLIVSFGVSAATDSTEFNIATSINDVVGVKVGAQGGQINTYSGFSSYAAIPSVTIVGGNGGTLSYDLEVYAMSNVAGKFTVSTTATPLRIGEEGYILPYTVTVDGSAGELVNSSAGKAITFINNFDQTNGLTFASKKFSVGVTEDALFAAESGDYSSTWTIEITTSN